MPLLSIFFIACSAPDPSPSIVRSHYVSDAHDSGAPPPQEDAQASPDVGATEDAPTTSAAKTYFTMNVYTTLIMTCGNCHQDRGAGSPPYLASSAETAYAAMTVTYAYDKAGCGLVSKGQHEGPALTQDQMTILSMWFELEAK